MSLQLAYFRVSINAAGLGGSDPADGFVDNKTPRDWSKTVGFPTTDAAANAKTRANLRWKEIMQRVSTQISPQIIDVDAPGATPDTPASSISFTLIYDREEFIFTDDEINGGTLTLEAAIKREVARALVTDLVRHTQVYNPSVEDYQDRLVQITVGKLAASIQAAETKITVARVPNT